MATIRDVAAEAGVSIATVSFVLNGKGKEKKVAEETCERVMTAAVSLGYRPNVSARKLRGAQEEKPIIVLYWPMDGRTSYLATILKGFRTEIERRQFDCELTIRTYQNDHLYEEKELLRPLQYSAAIIGAASAADVTWLESTQAELPLVLFNRRSAAFHSIVADDEKAVREAVALISFHGHRELAIFGNRLSYTAAEQRLQTLQRCCTDAGISIKAESTFYVEDSYDGGRAAARAYLALEHRPSAVITMTDTIALGASYQFARQKIHCPEDLELLAFGIGDPDAAAYANPAISVMEVPTKEMAQMAIDLAVDMVRHPSTSGEKQLRKAETALVLRETCMQ